MQEDKIKHIVLSFIITITVYYYLDLFTASMISLTIGTAKEIVDKYYYKSGFCWQDMKANCIGIVLACIATL
ncbi:hypothetical protein D3C86_2208460 [compost metagenome]